MSKIHKNCALCDEPVTTFEIQSELKTFCCHGCSAVYKILESQNGLDQKKEHTLMKEALHFGLISNPSLIEKILKQENQLGGTRKKWVFEVREMWCPSCADFIRLVIGSQKGVFRCVVDYATDLASIEFDPQILSKKSLQISLQKLGYLVYEIKDAKGGKEHSLLALRFGVAAFCALNVMMFAYPLYTTYFSFEDEGMRPLLAWISLALTLPVIIFSGNPIFKRMIVQGKQGIIGMEALVGIGITAALILSLYEMFAQTFHIYFDTITVLIAFLLLGKMIESKAKFSTKEALFRLYHALPRKGRKYFPDHSSRFVPLKEVEIGDEMIAYSGERIVIDGLVVDGEGACDESVLTGESIPLFKQKGDLVLSGSILQNGHLRYRVTAKNEESTLHHILKLVENEINEKSRYIRAADHIVKWFTPLVLAIAFFTFACTFIVTDSFLNAFSRSMAVLLIACPCAIGIAAPLIESKLIHRFTEKGGLVRNRALLAKFPLTTHFVFDKTGTITEGRFQVLSGLELLSEFNQKRLKSLVSHSSHPISKAIDLCLPISGSACFKISEIIGRGMRGEDDKGSFYLGSFRLMEEQGFTLSAHNMSTVYFADNEQFYPIHLGDVVKQDAHEMLKELKGVHRILLSGDHEKTVEAIANSLEFDSFKGGVSPLEKQTFIADLKKSGAHIAMIGDGINDAPALAKADVGISVVSATDISIQVSDLLLTTSNLNVIPELLKLAKKGQRLIQQNLFWAFFYNVVGIILAICGVLTPLFASFAMIISSLIVLFNAKRI